MATRLPAPSNKMTITIKIESSGGETEAKLTMDKNVWICGNPSARAIEALNYLSDIIDQRMHEVFRPKELLVDDSENPWVERSSHYVSGT